MYCRPFTKGDPVNSMFPHLSNLNHTTATIFPPPVTFTSSLEPPIKSLATPSTPPVPSETNIIKGFITGIGQTLKKGKRSTTQLYTNYKTVKKIKASYNVNPGSISYPEFSLMQRGVEDRWKLLNVMSLMVFASDFAPYALMFYPQMLPSTFSSRFYVPEEKEVGEKKINEQYVQELVAGDLSRRHAVLEAMIGLERSCVKPGFIEGEIERSVTAVNTNVSR